MVIQYMIFYISVGILAALLLKAFSIFTFRTKSKVMGYEFEVNSAEYKQYKSRVNTPALVLTLLSIVGLSLLVALQILLIARKHMSNSTITMMIGAGVSVVFVFWVFYSVVRVAEKIRARSSGKPSHANDKRSKNNTWQA